MILRRVLYFVWLATLGYIGFKDFTHVVPYNSGVFDYLFSDQDQVTNTVWLFVVVGSLLSLFPLLKKDKIGLLALLVLIPCICKPLVIDEVKKESAVEFFEARERQLGKLIEDYKLDTDLEKVRTAAEELGFSNFTVVDNSYIFTVNGILDNSHGFVYDEDAILPKTIYQSSTSYEPFKGNWFRFFTT